MDRLINRLMVLGGLVYGCFVAYAWVTERPSTELAKVEARLNGKIDSEAAAIRGERAMLSAARDAQVNSLKETIDRNHLIYMDQFRRLDGYLTEFIRQQNARAGEDWRGGGS